MSATPHVRRWTFCSAAACLALPLGAQTLFEERPVKQQDLLIPAAAFAAVDVDLDGDQDLVADDRLYLNDGLGGFTDVSSTHLPAGPGAVSQVLVVDVDGDGDPDLLLAQGSSSAWYASHQPRLLVNDGTGRFADRTATQLPAMGAGTTAMAVGDVDGDGDPDLVLAVYSGSNGRISHFPEQNLLYRNDGTGTFTDATTASLPTVTDNTTSVVCADLDADGDLDVVFGNVVNLVSSVDSRVCLNLGGGRFVDLPPGRLPPGGAWQPWHATDIDRDGDVDLLTSGSAGVLRNDGTGTFTADASVPSTVLGGAAVFDFDGDPNPDLVVGEAVFLGTRNGPFVALPSGQYIEQAHPVVLAFDPDRDGDHDLLYGNGVFQLKASDGWFHPNHVPRFPAAYSRGEGIAVGDLDGDGLLDIVSGTSIWMQRGASFESDSIGRFPVTDPADHSAWANALGDVDGDGDLDLAIASYWLPQHQFEAGLLLNDGRGVFTDVSATQLPLWSHGLCTDVQLVDVDGDGALDLVYATDAGNALFWNDGAGNFTDVTSFALPPNLGPGLDVAVDDVDGDGDPDLVFANGNYGPFPSAANQNRLLLNDGLGNFLDATASRFPAITHANYCVRLADIDGDGDPDLVFGGTQEFFGTGFQQTPDMLWENDGRGSFRDVTAGRMPPAVRDTTSIDVGDVDEDGDLDIVLSRFGGPFVLLNDGAGSFTDSTSAILPGSEPFVRTVSLDDLDGDGDADLTLSSVYNFPGLGCGGTCPSGTGLHLYTNLARHLEAPKLALSGNSYDLQLFARGALPGQTTLALPVLAPRTAYVPVPPYGIFGLDPASVISLPAVAIPQPAGETTLRIAVPTSPSLLGVPVHTQALIARLPGVAHLTDVVHDVILR